MNIAEKLKIALIDVRTQKRYTRATLCFLVLSLVVFVGVNSIIGSVRDSIHTLEKKPDGRLLLYVNYEREIRSLYNYLKNDYENREALGDVFFTSSEHEIGWKDAKGYVGVNDVSVTVFSYFAELEKYHCDGENRKPNRGEVVLPKYLYDMGIYDNVNYFDSTELVGKDITVMIEGAEGKYEETLRVIGTYDNISSQMFSRFLLNDEQVLEWYLDKYVVTEESINTYIQSMDEQQLEEIAVVIEGLYQGNEEAFWQDWIGAQPNLCIYVNAEYDMDEINKDIQEKTGEQGLRYTMLDESLLLYLDFLNMAGNLISGLLILTTMINIVLMTSAEISRREKEFALRRTQGFMKKDIIEILAQEKIVSFGFSVLFAVLVVGVILIGGNYVIDQLFPFYLRYVELSYDGNVLLGAIGCALAGVMLGICMTLPCVWKSDLMTTLRGE